MQLNFRQAMKLWVGFLVQVDQYFYVALIYFVLHISALLEKGMKIMSIRTWKKLSSPYFLKAV